MRNSDGMLGPGQAFRWNEQSGFQLLDNLIDFSDDSTSSAISADGAVIVGSAVSNDIERGFRQTAVLWKANGEAVDLGELTGGEMFSNAMNVSPMVRSSLVNPLAFEVAKLFLDRSHWNDRFR